MRKVEVGRGFFSRSVSSVPAEGMSKDLFFKAMDVEYPLADGWEVVSVLSAGIAGNSFGLGVFLCQYKYVPDTASAKSG